MFILNLTEIVGTKDYRQPEWVTQMEEMREALKGNICNFELSNYYIKINMKKKHIHKHTHIYIYAKHKLFSHKNPV